jgi:hypothetical protein
VKLLKKKEEAAAKWRSALDDEKRLRVDESTLLTFIE